MKKYGSNIWVILLSASLYTGCAYSGNTSSFTKEEVNKNVYKYLNDILQNKKGLTLQQYYIYEGSHDEKEFYLELLECDKKWKNSYFLRDGKIYMNENCLEWSSSRNLNAKKIDSLYYTRLKRKLEGVLNGLKISSIEKQSNAKVGAENIPWKVIFTNSDKNINLTVLHAANKSMTDIFYMRLTQINGENVMHWLDVDVDEIRDRAKKNNIR